MLDLRLGDCLEVLKTIPDNSVDLIVTDPPYEFGTGGGAGAFGIRNQKYHEEYLALFHQAGKTRETERLRIKSNAVKNGENTRLISSGFDFKILDEAERIMKAWNIYVWCSKAQLRKLLVYFEDKGCAIDVLTWHKTNPIPTCNNTYLSDTEYCVFARGKGVKVYGSVETKHKYYVTPANVADKKIWKHPTIKPLHIIENLIINSSQEGETVMDMFMGSGTTGVACRKLKRNFIGIEIDEKYFKTE